MPESVIHLASGGARLAIDADRGGRIASWSVDGRELLVGAPTPDDRSIRWGCFLMAPWAGRLADGRFWGPDGRLVQVPRTHGRNAIHGLLWDRAWTVDQVDPERAVLTCLLPGEVWPPGARVRHEISLAGGRLELVATVTSAAAGPASAMPVAIGWHPWFQRDAGTGGDVSVRVDAAEVLVTERMIPNGDVVPVAGRTDLRRGPRLGRRRIDHSYVDARSPAVLRWDDLKLAIAFSPSPTTVVVYTLPDSLCVEPQTAWPNAPALKGAARTRSGLRMVRPGESLTASMSLAVIRP